MSPSPPHGDHSPDGVEELWDLVMSQARCPGSGLDPDLWFPVSHAVAAARREAAEAIAVCATCPVRQHCLELSLRSWYLGQHGVWGGLLPAERKPLRIALTAASSRSRAPA